MTTTAVRGWNLEETTAPVFSTTHPVNLDEVKSMIKVDSSEFDSELLRFIEAVTIQEQNNMGIQIPTATYKLHLDGFPTGAIEIPRPPVTSIASVTYLDETGASQTLAASKYRTNITTKPAFIVNEFGQTWPTTRGVPRDVTVEFICGYASGSVPVELRLLIAHRVGSMFHGCADDVMVTRQLRATLGWML